MEHCGFIARTAFITDDGSISCARIQNLRSHAYVSSRKQRKRVLPSKQKPVMSKMDRALMDSLGSPPLGLYFLLGFMESIC